MTLEELWILLPIVLTPHQPQWADRAQEEIEALSEILTGYAPVISHIGSTAIPCIQAKPIIDILVEIAPETDWQRIRSEMIEAGYICMSSSERRMSFNKGYTPEGYAERVFHIHVHVVGDPPAVAREYEALKLSLLPRYKNDRDGYTEAKSDFVRAVVDDARKQQCYSSRSPRH